MIQKIFTVIDQVVTKSFILFPNMLLAYAVTIHKNTITFAWPFILGYSIGQITPYFINTNLSKNWHANYQLLALIATTSTMLASLGIFSHLEALASLGAIGLSFGVTGLASLSDINHHKSTFKFTNFFSSILMVIILLLLGLLVMKVSLLSAYLFYSFILVLEFIGIYLLFKPSFYSIPQLFDLSWRSKSIGFIIFIAIFLISLFKKTGRFSNISWIFIILASLEIIFALKTKLIQPFKAFRIWIGAVRNYLIIFSLIFAFQQHQTIWIFIVFIEMSIAGVLAKIINFFLSLCTLTKQFYIEISVIFLALILIIWTKFYLLGTGIIFIFLISISSSINQIKPIKKNGLNLKISVLGSLWCQTILFAIFQLISIIKFHNKTVLILPFVKHHIALQYDPEMTTIRIIMCILFIVIGILIIIHDHNTIKSPQT